MEGESKFNKLEAAKVRLALNQAHWFGGSTLQGGVGVSAELGEIR